MEIINIKKYKKMPKKNIIILSVILFSIILILSILTILYLNNNSVKEFIDVHIFRKEISQGNLKQIIIDAESNKNLYAYDKYITVLNKSNLIIYDGQGQEYKKLDILIGTPIYSSNNRFLCIAEASGKRVYLISNGQILWEKEVEGTINKIDVNKNGYVSIITSGTSYKTVIITYNPDGKEIFKTYLSSTISVGTTISNDNKYLAVAEVDTSGAAIQSCVKVISIEKAKTDPSNSVIYTYNANSGEVISRIKYQDKGQLVCMYDDGIHVINNEQDSVILVLETKGAIADINLKNYIAYVTEKSTGLFSSNTNVLFKNVQNNTENTYEIQNALKEVKMYDDKLVVNLGSEVHFINTAGWLERKYVSTQEITDILLGSSIAGIVYRDKIEIINF